MFNCTLPKLSAYFCLDFSIMEQGDQLLRKTCSIAPLCIDTNSAQILPRDWRIKGNGGQAHSHVVEQFARAFGQAQLGCNRHVAQRKNPENPS